MVNTKTGKVILAGAGPGDPELISLKAFKYLQKADVILTDRLVSPTLITENAREDAAIIYVGKQCSKGIHTPQKHINQIMADYAKQGKLVLRLKGGDANLFSNILDELETLVAQNIPYEIIPGISAAFGASALAGIPLTARGYSKALRLLTLCDLKDIKTEQWNDWAATDDTLVFYMSGQRIRTLVNELMLRNIDGNKSLAVIQQATTPEQKTLVYKFGDMTMNALPNFEYVPTLLIVGNVVSLHEKFAWMKEKQDTESYFDNHINLLTHAI